MRVRLWGTRGSIPTPDADKLRYGGNTSCVSVALDGGGELILDAGTGIRALGAQLYGRPGPHHILLTHLHLDHIIGLLFFAPFFDPSTQVVVWGPPGGLRDLRHSLARYLSAPLSPIEIHELPASVEFNEVPYGPWRVLGAQVTADLVTHRGRTLGYRIEESGRSLCYLPDHEPGLGQDLERTPGDWISGFELARDVDLLLHDAQYTRDEYLTTAGWGHSRVDDTLRFARRVQAARTLLIHHDPAHNDTFLDDLEAWATAEWNALGGAGGQLTLGAEGAEQSF